MAVLRHNDGSYLIPPEDERETGTRKAGDAGFRRPTSQPALEQRQAPEPIPSREDPAFPTFKPQRCDPVDEITRRPKGFTRPVKPYDPNR